MKSENTVPDGCGGLIKTTKDKLPKPPKPQLVLCDDWCGVARVLRKQLKPHGLTVTARTRRGDDMIEWEVTKI